MEDATVIVYNQYSGRVGPSLLTGVSICFDLQLVIVWTTGIVVLVRCFSHERGFEKEIIHRLGSSFSRVPYIIVVVCTRDLLPLHHPFPANF